MKTFVLDPATYERGILAVGASVSEIIQHPDHKARVRVNHHKATRSDLQNDKLWPVLRDISRQVEWVVDNQAVYMGEEDWKTVFSAALTKHLRVARGVDGGFVMLGTRTSSMSVEMFSNLLELALAFGTEHNVRWSE